MTVSEIETAVTQLRAQHAFSDLRPGPVSDLLHDRAIRVRVDGRTVHAGTLRRGTFKISGT